MPDSPTPIRVLVIRAGALGDTVCATSIIEPLRIEFGESVEIEWIAKAGMGGLFAADNRINRVHELRNRRLPLPLNRRKAAIVHTSRHRPYDYVINLELGTLFNDMVRAVHARNKIGMPYHHFAEPPEAHAVENLHLIFKSFLSKDAMQKATPSLRGITQTELRTRHSLPEQYIVLVPANSHIGKHHALNHRAWPLRHWKTLIQELHANNVNSILIGGQQDITLVNELTPLPSTCHNLVGKTPFPELISLIEHANHVVATDTGPAHIAAAVNTSITALIGPTNFRRTGPYPTAHNRINILTASLPCSPCYHTPALDACTDNICMKKLTPDEVAYKVLGRKIP